MRNTLVAALASYPSGRGTYELREFLTGLSFDELQFLAEYRGACILSGARPAAGAGQAACLAIELNPSRQRATPDFYHKTFVLLEYLSRAGAEHSTPTPA